MPNSKHQKGNILIILVVIVLILLTAGGGFYLYQQNSNKSSAIPAPSAPKLSKSTESSIATSSSSYQNPFETQTYQNPFDNQPNPFDNLQ